MTPAETRNKVAIFSLFFFCICLLGIIIYQGKSIKNYQILEDGYKEQLRLRDSTINANLKISQEKQLELLGKADSVQKELDIKYKTDSVLFYNYEKDKSKYSGYTPARRNAALDSLLWSRKK